MVVLCCVATWVFIGLEACIRHTQGMAQLFTLSLQLFTLSLLDPDVQLSGL